MALFTDTVHGASFWASPAILVTRCTAHQMETQAPERGTRAARQTSKTWMQLGHHEAHAHDRVQQARRKITYTKAHSTNSPHTEVHTSTRGGHLTEYRGPTGRTQRKRDKRTHPQKQSWSGSEGTLAEHSEKSTYILRNSGALRTLKDVHIAVPRIWSHDDMNQNRHI